ncbi:MerR family transcriptional regulator [Paenibacillus sp. Y412MC10]|uniref:MerR family transcriptional regulator n=1 Tax=Geobacillus sp. (strain Y412MC10) TaxID=481743 RepID=UPI003965A642
MSIAQFAERTGMVPSALRFYESKGVPHLRSIWQPDQCMVLRRLLVHDWTHP